MFFLVTTLPSHAHELFADLRHFTGISNENDHGAICCPGYKPTDAMHRIDNSSDENFS